MLKEKKNSGRKGSGFPYGLYIFSDGVVQFSIIMPGMTKNLTLLIYHRGQKKPFFSFTMDKSFKTGSVFSIRVPLEVGKSYEYLYQTEQGTFVDPHASLICGRRKWGEYVPSEELRGGFHVKSFENRPIHLGNHRHEMEDLIIYRLHVRGFTKHRSSKVIGKGTFLGLWQKIPYLKALGVNAVELMPCYEFNECIYENREERFSAGASGHLLTKQVSGEAAATVRTFNGSASVPLDEKGKQESKKRVSQRRKPEVVQEIKELSDKKNETVSEAGLGAVDFVEQKPRINYWGYTRDAFYFAPKAAYAYRSEEADEEFRRMVEEFHANGIEVFMDIYFDEQALPGMMVQCLLYWRTVYGIDGFHLSNNEGDLDSVIREPLLSDVKLFRAHWEIDQAEASPEGRHFGLYHDGFLYDVRKFIKGDEGQVENLIGRVRCNSQFEAVVNYVANTNGFTLMDSVSYDWKHNEENGEHGNDGISYNASWNCGVEGKTRKKKILELRRQQVKNALLLLLTSQGIPLLLAGDEFGNSQKGNNNAYCQDNEISWLNWNDLDKEKELYAFVKRLIEFRRNHRILHQKQELLGMDRYGCGCPDFSVHGTKPWILERGQFSRVVAFLYCGYHVDEKKDIYIAFNTHWEAHSFHLPQALRDVEWKVVFETVTGANQEGQILKTGEIEIPPRCGVILEAEYSNADTRRSGRRNTAKKNRKRLDEKLSD